MRTQLSVALVATGIVGVLTAGTVSASILMGQEMPSVASAAAHSSKVSPPQTAPLRVTAPAPSTHRPAAVVPRTRKAAPTSKAAPKAPITYVVKPGDDLSSIAAWFALHGYGDLFRANRKVIGDNPDLIRPGQRITITGTTMTTR